MPAQPNARLEASISAAKSPVPTLLAGGAPRDSREAGCGRRPGARLRAGQVQDLAGVGCSRPRQRFRDLFQGPLPGDGLEPAFAPLAHALHRAAEPVRIVEGLQRCVAARAQPAAADRVRRIAFKLLDRRDLLAETLAVHFDLALRGHDPGRRPASRAAIPADARMPLLDSRLDLLLADQERDDLLGLLAAGPGDRAARCGAHEA